jgi:hypothetical protein
MVSDVTPPHLALFSRPPVISPLILTLPPLRIGSQHFTNDVPLLSTQGGGSPLCPDFSIARSCLLIVPPPPWGEVVVAGEPPQLLTCPS